MARFSPSGGGRGGLAFDDAGLLGDFQGAVRAADEWIGVLDRKLPEAAMAATEELGLYMEAWLKQHTRVDTGRARASWGHYTPSDMTSKATSKDRAEARAAAIYDGPTPHDFAVTVGSRVEYMPYLNYRLGDYMLEGAVVATMQAVPTIVGQYLRAIAKGV